MIFIDNLRAQVNVPAPTLVANLTETQPMDAAPDAAPVLFVVSGAETLLTVNGSQIMTHWQPDTPPPVGYFAIRIRSYQFGYALSEAKFVLQIVPA
jgi:hypothetical protein